MAWSLLLRGGTVVDGSGAPARRADVAVERERIVAVAPSLTGPADRVVDATGHVVAPGFIDMHSHSDLFYFACPSAESKVRQGVTTEVVGMCSFSQAPLRADQREIIRGWAGGIGASLDLRWETFAQYLDALRAVKPTVNVAHFVGHGALRIAAMGFEARPALADDLKGMQRLLGEAMDAGAFGFSTGLVYAPSAYSNTDELIALAKSMAARGGYYFSHIRGESSMLLDSINEAIRIGEECLIDGERWGTVSQGGIGFDQVFIATCRRRELEGLHLAQIARQAGLAPAEVLMNLLLEEKCTVGMVSFSQSIENVAKVLAHPALMIGSDSIPLYEGEGDRPGKPHPRTYGTFPRVLGEYARERRIFSLETAVHKMTGMAAGRIGLRERGLVQPGYFADLTVFDPATVKDESTYPEPHRYPTGIPYVVVNGTVAVDGSRLQARGTGRILTH